MKTNIPVVNYLPEKLRRWQDKFVQFTIGETPFLRVGPVDKYHADIVRLFCEELEIGYRTQRGRDSRDIVYPVDPRVKVVGAGDIYMIEGTYYYGGDSTGYGIKPDQHHMLKISGQFPDKEFVFNDI